MSNPTDIAVIGGGWSGLAAAVTLTQQGKPVHLFEAAGQLGGRARTIELNHLTVDNGHHLFVGAYRQLIALLATLDVDLSTVFRRENFSLNMQVNEKKIHLPSSSLPAPFNLLSSLLRASNISPGEKTHALIKGFALRKLPDSLTNDISVAAIFNKMRYPKQLIDTIWAPLCLAICNTKIADTSAQNFFNAIHQTFFLERDYSDILYPIKNLSDIIPATASTYLTRNNAKISLKQRVKSILIENNTIYGIKTNDVVIPVKNIILAVPPPAVIKLLDSSEDCQTLVTQLSQINFAPICTLYIHYPCAVTLPAPMLGVTNKTTQWVFDRQYENQAGLIAVIISGNGPHQNLKQSELEQLVTKEIAEIFPDWPAPLHVKVLWEKRATFTCCPGINTLRPEYKTSVKGLWLAGDYTQTGLPATLEGAVQSGVQCAQQLFETLD